MYIQLAFSSRNITDDLREKCDRLNAVYPAKVQKDNWQWRALYRTESIEIPEKIDKDELYKALDERLEQIEEFEAEARKILQE